MGTELRLRIYKMIDLAELLKNRDTIVKFIPDLPVKKEHRGFRMSDISGCWRYSNLQELFRNTRSQYLPQSIEEIQKAGRQFFEKFAKNYKQYREQNPTFNLPFILPGNFDLQEILEIYGEGNFPDHYLCRYQPKMIGTNQRGTYFPVLGSLIEVRVGNGGKIIGVNVQWRPMLFSHFESLVSKNRYSSLTHSHGHGEGHDALEDGTGETLSSDPDHDHAMHDHGNDSNGNTQHSESLETLCYLNRSENIFQNFATPMHAIVDGHHSNYLPASKSAFSVDIVEEHTDATVRLYSIIIGEGNRYSYEWAYYSIHALQNGLTYLGNSSDCEVPVGHFTIMLTVIDLSNGNIHQTIKNIFSHGKIEEENIYA